MKDYDLINCFMTMLIEVYYCCEKIRNVMSNKLIIIEIYALKQCWPTFFVPRHILMVTHNQSHIMNFEFKY